MLDKWQAEAEAFKAKREAIEESASPWIKEANKAILGVHARNSPIADYLLAACKMVRELEAAAESVVTWDQDQTDQAALIDTMFDNQPITDEWLLSIANESHENVHRFYRNVPPLAAAIQFKKGELRWFFNGTG